jgi:hypothetical protein
MVPLLRKDLLQGPPDEFVIINNQSSKHKTIPIRKIYKQLLCQDVILGLKKN